jgi:hypothetical protein
MGLRAWVWMLWRREKFEIMNTWSSASSPYALRVWFLVKPPGTNLRYLATIIVYSVLFVHVIYKNVFSSISDYFRIGAGILSVKTGSINSSLFINCCLACQFICEFVLQCSLLFVLTLCTMSLTLMKSATIIANRINLEIVWVGWNSIWKPLQQALVSLSYT